MFETTVFIWILIIYGISVILCHQVLHVIYSSKGKLYNEIEYVSTTNLLTYFPVCNTLYVMVVWLFINPYNITYRKDRKNIKVVKKMFKIYSRIVNGLSISFTELLNNLSYPVNKNYEVRCLITDLTEKQETSDWANGQRVALLIVTIDAYNKKYQV